MVLGDMTLQDIRFKKLPAHWRRGFEEAEAVSEYSNATQVGFRMGAALFSGNNLIGLGFNLTDKTHPQSKVEGFNVGRHAEHSALIKRRHYGDNKLVMYVWRQTEKKPRNNGKNGCSKPCANCQALMKFAGVRRVRFINELGDPEEMKL